MRRLLLAVVLAGCLGAGEPSDGPVPEAAGAWAPPVLVGAGGFPDVGEASLAVGPDGTLLVCAVESAKVFASQDSGATWTATEPFDGVTNGDCDVAVGDGLWYAAWARRADSVAVSRDGGATWTATTVTPSPVQCVGNPVTGSQTLCAAHRPWLHAFGQTVYVTYYDLRPTVVLFGRSLDGGTTWDRPTLVASSPGFGVAGRMSVADEGRTVRVPLLLPEPPPGDGYRVVVAESEDAGETWTSRVVAGALPVRFGFPSLADHDGRLTLATALENGTLADVVLFTSDDAGATWDGPTTLAPGVDFGESMALLALDEGPEGAVAAWFHRVQGSGWTVTVTPELDPGARRPPSDGPPLGGEDDYLEFFGMDHGPDGALHIVVPVPEDACEPEGPNCLYHLLAPRS
ncbi:MAG TPA: sialidase family protein [Candidatus Thermoplasmatota archaeon]|nr:sialidase family protein [Candidatus Thermoplasmatota archaeon]